MIGKLYLLESTRGFENVTEDHERAVLWAGEPGLGYYPPRVVLIQDDAVPRDVTEDLRAEYPDVKRRRDAEWQRRLDDGDDCERYNDRDIGDAGEKDDDE